MEIASTTSNAAARKAAARSMERALGTGYGFGASAGAAFAFAITSSTEPVVIGW